MTTLTGDAATERPSSKDDDDREVEAAQEGSEGRGG